MRDQNEMKISGKFLILYLGIWNRFFKTGFYFL